MAHGVHMIYDHFGPIVPLTLPRNLRATQAVRAAVFGHERALKHFRGRPTYLLTDAANYAPRDDDALDAN